MQVMSIDSTFREYIILRKCLFYGMCLNFFCFIRKTVQRLIINNKHVMSSIVKLLFDSKWKWQTRHFQAVSVLENQFTGKDKRFLYNKNWNIESSAFSIPFLFLFNGLNSSNHDIAHRKFVIFFPLRD